MNIKDDLYFCNTSENTLYQYSDETKQSIKLKIQR